MGRLVLMVNITQIFYICMNAMGKIIMNKPVGSANLWEFTMARSVVLSVFSWAALRV